MQQTKRSIVILLFQGNINLIFTVLIYFCLLKKGGNGRCMSTLPHVNVNFIFIEFFYRQVRPYDPPQVILT